MIGRQQFAVVLGAAQRSLSTIGSVHVCGCPTIAAKIGMQLQRLEQRPIARANHVERRVWLHTQHAVVIGVDLPGPAVRAGTTRSCASSDSSSRAAAIRAAGRQRRARRLRVYRPQGQRGQTSWAPTAIFTSVSQRLHADFVRQRELCEIRADACGLLTTPLSPNAPPPSQALARHMRPWMLLRWVLAEPAEVVEHHLSRALPGIDVGPSTLTTPAMTSATASGVCPCG